MMLNSGTGKSESQELHLSRKLKMSTLRM